MVLSVGVGIFQNLIEGGLKRLLKKAGHVVGMPLDSLKPLYENDCKKNKKKKHLMQIRSCCGNAIGQF